MVTFGFFDSVNGDRKYSADDMSNFFEALIPDGVTAVPEETMQVTAVSGMTVKISAGWGFIQRKWVHNDADLLITLDQPGLAFNRCDRIVLRLNRDISMRNIEIAVRKGNYGVTASEPELRRDESVYELSLAAIDVRAGSTELTQADILDERNNTDVCGRVCGLDKIIELLNEIADLKNKLGDCRYYCNSQNDNIILPEFIASWSQSHPGETLKVVGKFGVNDDISDIDGIVYSMVYENVSDLPVILDFSECSLITAKSGSFARFDGCHVRGLKIRYDNAVPENQPIMHVLAGLDSVFEDCHVYGSASGSGTSYISCYKIDGSSLLKCSADFSSGNTLWGIMTTGDSVISECSIKVTGTADEPVYGISASDGHCISSRFKAVGSSAYGGSTGGDFTECLFDALGEINGYGFRINQSFHAGNCTFRGYTRDAESGIGCGLYGKSASAVLLQGIRCPEWKIPGYYQTGSMVLTGGEGFYTGKFYAPPELPEENTILTYTDFLPGKAMTQAEYDALEKENPNTLYVLT